MSVLYDPTSNKDGTADSRDKTVDESDEMNLCPDEKQERRVDDEEYRNCRKHKGDYDTPTVANSYG